MNACPAFEVPLAGDAAATLSALADRVRELGGLLTGDGGRGAFAVRVPLARRAVRGTYTVAGAVLRIEVTDRPLFIPCDLLTNVLREGLDAPDATRLEPIPTRFDIEVRFLGGLTATQQDVFMGAAARWSRVIVGDLPPVRMPSGEIIDDIVINARGAFIDGVGRVLGRAGPTGLRPGSLLPATGMMEFDTADLARMEMDGTLENVIVHEMGHVLGVGSLWGAGLFDLLSGAGGRNPLYTGANATREFAALLGVAAPRPVPVENTGGPGTADAHWRESVFMNELMTGFIGEGRNPLSRLTVAALQDMGYEVNYDAAEEYALPGEMELRLRGLDTHLEQCGGAVMLRPKPVVLPDAVMRIES